MRHRRRRIHPVVLLILVVFVISPLIAVLIVDYDEGKFGILGVRRRAGVERPDFEAIFSRRPLDGVKPEDLAEDVKRYVGEYATHKADDPRLRREGGYLVHDKGIRKVTPGGFQWEVTPRELAREAASPP